VVHPINVVPEWLEITIHAPSVTHEALNSFLFDLGCQGVILTDSPEVRLQGYLPAPFDIPSVQKQLELFVQNLQEFFPEAQPVQCAFSRIEPEDWAANWRRFFKPDKITSQLMVVPAWEPVPPDRTEVIIKMDPGPAFGTGQHATTRMCLAAMEAVPLKANVTMLDVGTGSGILAIYGAKLGAGRIVALDNDPEALAWAKRNIALNSIADVITLSDQTLETWTEHFPLVVANLILGTILELAPALSARLAPDGRLILSGLLSDQVPEVETVLKNHGLGLEKTLQQDEWVCLVFRRSGLSLNV
jgi:ribosomal protein L11 methyltransferase